MGKRLVTLFVLAFSICALSAGAFASDKQGDWKKLDNLLADFYHDFNSQSFLNKQTVGTFTQKWTEWKKAYNKTFEDFKSGYGTSREQIMKAFEGVKMPEGADIHIWPLVDALANIDITAQEKKMAGWAEELGTQHYRRWKSYKAPAEKAELKLKYAERAKAFINTASALDKEKDLKEIQGKIKAAISESRKAFEENLKKIKWPGHNEEFKGNAKALSKAAIAFLKKTDRWSKPEYDDEHIPVAACVTGNDWQVYKKTIMGVPTQYSIDMLVAFKGKKSGKTLYAYHMVFYTKEEAGVKPALPLHFGNSKQYACFKILKSAVPNSGGSCPGIFGSLVRALLCVLLLGASLFALEATLKQQYKFMGIVYKTIDPLLGVVAPLSILASLAFLLLSILTRFNPFADILPQAALFLLGLTLRAEKAAGKKEADMNSFSGVLRINKDAIGWAGIFLTITHLFAGCIWFF